MHDVGVVWLSPDSLGLRVASIAVIAVVFPLVVTGAVFIACGVRCSLRVGAQGRLEVASSRGVQHLLVHITPCSATAVTVRLTPARLAGPLAGMIVTSKGTAPEDVCSEDSHIRGDSAASSNTGVGRTARGQALHVP